MRVLGRLFAEWRYEDGAEESGRVQGRMQTGTSGEEGSIGEAARRAGDDTAASEAVAQKKGSMEGGDSNFSGENDQGANAGRNVFTNAMKERQGEQSDDGERKKGSNNNGSGARTSAHRGANRED
jgi:hypothetical protein